MKKRSILNQKTKWKELYEIISKLGAFKDISYDVRLSLHITYNTYNNS